MATEFKVNRGNESIIKDVTKVPITSGTLSLTEDGQNIYLDSNDGSKRIHITDVIDLSINDPKVYYPNKIYISGTQLKFWNNTTQTLDVISDLENIPIESNNAFIYDENDSHKATIIDSNSPTLGTIIFDKNGDCGIVTKVDGETIYVSILSNPATSEVLTGRDIYFDSTYTGIQVGTINKPFNNWTNLFNNCKGELQDKIPTTIHLLSNSEVRLSSLNINNVTFIGDSMFNASIVFIADGADDVAHINESNDVCFKNVSIDVDVNNTNNKKFKTYFSTITFYNCEMKCTCRFDNSVIETSHSRFKNIEVPSAQYAGETVNTSLIIKDCYIFNDISIIIGNNTDTDKIVIEIYDTRIFGSLYENGYKPNDLIVNLTNTIIDKNLLLPLQCNVINLNSGSVSDTSEVNINSKQINLGLFNFKGTSLTLNGNVNTLDGLNSKQVYDKTERNYGNKNETLESHLDAIDKILNNLSNNTSETDNPSIIELDSLKSKFVFDEYDTIDTNVIYSVGDVIKYIGSKNVSLKSYWDKLPIDIVEFNTDSAIGKGKINGARYLLKANDAVYINYGNIDYEAIPLLRGITSNGTFTFELKNKDDAANLESFTDSDTEIKEKYSNSYYVSNMIINPNDRLVCVAIVDNIPIWDKLTNTSEDIDATTLVGKEVTDFAFSGTYESLNESIPTNNAIYTITTNEISGTEDTFMIMWSENAKLAVSKNTNKIYRNNSSGTNWIEIGNDVALTGTYNSLDDIPNKSGLYVVRTNEIPSTSDVYANYSIIKHYSEYGSTTLAISDLGQIYIKNNNDDIWSQSSDDTPKSIAEGGCRLKYIKRQEIPEERIASQFEPKTGVFVGERDNKYYSYFVEDKTINIKYHESKNDDGTIMTIEGSESFPKYYGNYYTVALDSQNSLLYIVVDTNDKDLSGYANRVFKIYKYSITSDDVLVLLSATDNTNYNLFHSDYFLGFSGDMPTHESIAVNNELYFLIGSERSHAHGLYGAALIYMDKDNNLKKLHMETSDVGESENIIPPIGNLFHDGSTLYWRVVTYSSGYKNYLYAYPNNKEVQIISKNVNDTLWSNDSDIEFYDDLNNVYIYSIDNLVYIIDLNSESYTTKTVNLGTGYTLQYTSSIKGSMLFHHKSNIYPSYNGASALDIISIGNIPNFTYKMFDQYTGKNFGIIWEDKYIYIDQGDGTELVYAII